MKESKQNLLDVTFLFLVKLDTIERLENVLAVTNFLILNVETNIEILECAPYNNGLLEKLLDRRTHYTFQKDHDPILFRTKFLNQMVKTVNTPFVAVWDTDVIAHVDQVVNAVELLRNGEAAFVYPYESSFLDTSHIIRKLYLDERKIEILEENVKKMKEMYAPNPVGGAFLANTKAYKEAGLENENFYGWGAEDGERVYRWENLNYKVKRVRGSLFHLSHTRGINSTFHNPDQRLIKLKELISIRRNNNKSLLSSKRID